MTHGTPPATAGARTGEAVAALRALFSAHRFHPSSAGYAVIAAELSPVLLEAVTALRRAA